MKLGNIKLGKQLTTFGILLVLLPVTITGWMIYNRAKANTIEQLSSSLQEQAKLGDDHVHSYYNLAQQRVLDALATARISIIKGVTVTRSFSLDENQPIDVTAVNQVTKQAERTSIPSFLMSGVKLNYDNTYVNRLKQEIKTAVTIFQVIPQGLLRISTNVLKEDGTPAVDTFIPKDSPVTTSILNGQQYIGRAFVVNSNYMTAYEPIRDPNGKVIGALFVGIPEKTIQEEALNSFRKAKLGATGYVYVLSPEGKYILSLNGQHDGQDISNTQDADGRYVIKEIIQIAKNLKDGEVTTYQYYWPDPATKTTRLKITGVVSFPEWDWIICYGAYEDEFLTSLQKIKTVLLFSTVMCLAFGIIIAIKYSQLLTTPITKVEKLMQAFANNDFAQEHVNDKTLLQLKNNQNELGSLARSAFAMHTSVAGMLRQIKNDSTKLAAATTEMSGIFSQISRNAMETSDQASTVASASEESRASFDSVASAVEEMGATVREIAQSASATAGVAEKATEQLNQTTAVVSELGNTSSEIGAVIKLIETIAEQTNLLALNATIEAARAGEAGKGFAVVANEVKELAKQTATATKNISDRIDAIQKSVKDVVTSVSSFSSLIKEIHSASHSIASAVEEQNATTTEIARQISEAVQTNTIIAQNITSVSNVADQTSAQVSEASNASTELGDMAAGLRKLVDSFTV